jgi:hypothetical protein
MRRCSAGSVRPLSEKFSFSSMLAAKKSIRSFISRTDAGLRAKKRAASFQNEDATEKSQEIGTPRAVASSSAWARAIRTRTRLAARRVLRSAGNNAAELRRGMRGSRRSAPSGDDVPAWQRWARLAAPLAGAACTRAHVVDEIVVDVIEPDVLQVRRHRILGEREPHQIDEAPVFRTALEPAAPILGRPQHERAVGLDLGAILGLELAAVGDDNRRVLTLRVRGQHRADGSGRLLPARFLEFASLSHGTVQTCVGVSARWGGAISRVCFRTACLSP